MSIVARKSFFNLAISIISEINLTPSPICLFLTYAVCCVETKSGRTFLIFSGRTVDIIFKSTFNKEMGFQFYMNLFS